MRTTVALLVASSLLVACRPSSFDRPSNWNELDGWVEFAEEAVRIEGRLVAVAGAQPWIVRDESGQGWVPMRVPESFQLEGLRIEADVRLRPDLLSAGLPGELVEVLRIRESTGSDAPTAASADEASDPWPASSGGSSSVVWGEWRVIGHFAPGVQAMSSARAASWTGRALEFGPSSARSPNGECLEPSYPERIETSDAVLSGEYGVPVESVPPVGDVENLRVVEVRCAGDGWNAAGAVLLVIDERRALAPWDGVFFELRRSR